MKKFLFSGGKHTLLNRIKDARNDEDLENASPYFDISMISIRASLKVNSIEQDFFHMNISSLSQLWWIWTLLARMKVKFNIISITKTRFKKHTAIIIRIINKNLNGYAKEHTPTEANCGSALLYIDNSLNYSGSSLEAVESHP